MKQPIHRLGIVRPFALGYVWTGICHICEADRRRLHTWTNLLSTSHFTGVTTCTSMSTFYSDVTHQTWQWKKRPYSSIYDFSISAAQCQLHQSLCRSYCQRNWCLTKSVPMHPSVSLCSPQASFYYEWLCAVYEEPIMSVDGRQSNWLVTPIYGDTSWGQTVLQ